MPLRLVVLLVATSLGVAACGSSEGATGAATTLSAADPTSTPASTAPTTTAPPDTTTESPLVDAAWLDANTGSYVLVDVSSADAYDAGHLQGAVNLPSNRVDDPAADVGSQLSSSEVVAAALGDIGVNPAETVVLYDGTSSLYATRVYYAMRLYGHQDLRILDGGSIAWEQDGRTLSTEAVSLPPSDYPVGDATGAVRYELDDLDAHRDGGGTFADARAPGEYSGETTFGDEQGGHIPGAVNLDWEQTVGPDGRFLDVASLRDLYAEAGITPDSPVVTYCYIGVRAAHTWFVLSELLGYPDVALYDGSWSEYGSTEGVEIET